MDEQTAEKITDKLLKFFMSDFFDDDKDYPEKNKINQEDIKELKSYKLIDMILANDFIRNKNKSIEKGIIKMLCDDRLISAIYTILHFEEDKDINDDKYTSIISYNSRQYTKKHLVIINQNLSNSNEDDE